MILFLVVVATNSAPDEEPKNERSQRIIGIFSPTNRGRLTYYRFE